MTDVYKRLRELQERKWTFEARLRTLSGKPLAIARTKRNIAELERTIKVNKAVLKKNGYASPKV